MGIDRTTKSGLGSASLHAGRLVVAAIVAVNAFGDVVDPSDGQIVAGARGRHGDGFVDTSRAMRSPAVRNVLAFRNTVIGVVATNARLDVAQVNQVAAVAHDGLARVVRPAHTLYDGDVFFALATGKVRSHPALVGDMASEVTASAILNAIWSAKDAGGLPAASSLRSMKPSP